MYEEAIRFNAMMAARYAAEVRVEQFRGFGETEAEAMRDAVESRRVTWDAEEGATWDEITADAKSAGILTFTTTPHGVVVWDNN